MLHVILPFLATFSTLATAGPVEFVENERLGTTDLGQLGTSGTQGGKVELEIRNKQAAISTTTTLISSTVSAFHSMIQEEPISASSSSFSSSSVSDIGSAIPSSSFSTFLSTSSASSSLSSQTSSSTASLSAAPSITSTSLVDSTSIAFTTTITSSTGSSSSTAAASTTSSTIPPYTAGVLPAPTDWQSLRGYAWNVTQNGILGFNDYLASKDLQGDKCRTGSVGDAIIWNCGDMECAPDWTACGFSMGPGFYGTDSVTIVDTGNLTNIGNDIFMPAWSGDPPPSGNQTAWGMDMSNVVPINSTHGVVYAWEIWRGAPDGSYVDRGNAVASVTLGSTFPIATRQGPLLTDASAIQLGLLATMADGGYIYLYSMPQSSGIITVTRVPASDAVFDITQYETLNSNGLWMPGVPTTSEAAASYGMVTAQPGGFGCATYGSVFYNAYLKKYLILCNVWEYYTNMYASDTPTGPWSAEYGILSGVSGYGSMAHPEYSPDGGKTIPWTQGPNTVFDIFMLSFY